MESALVCKQTETGWGFRVDVGVGIQTRKDTYQKKRKDQLTHDLGRHTITTSATLDACIKQRPDNVQNSTRAETGQEQTTSVKTVVCTNAGPRCKRLPTCMFRRIREIVVMLNLYISFTFILCMSEQDKRLLDAAALGLLGWMDATERDVRRACRAFHERKQLLCVRWRGSCLRLWTSWKTSWLPVRRKGIRGSLV